MREEHRREMRDEDWGGRHGGPEWGGRHGRGGGRYGAERGGPGFPGGPGFGGPAFADGPGFSGGPGGPGGPGGLGGPGGRGGRGRRGPGGRGWDRGEGEAFGPEGHGFPGRFGFGFGPGFPDGPFGPRGGGRGGRGSRARKGDVRAAVLDLFAEDVDRTWNGYQLIQEIPARTDGAWRPSAGSVYPALQQLEDESLIAPQGTGRRRVYSLTDAGREYVGAHADELRGSWDAAAGMTDDDAIEFRNLIRQVMMAVMEVRRAGSAEQVAQARAVLAQARKSLYLILAEDDTADTGAGAAGSNAGREPQGTVPQDAGAQDTPPATRVDNPAAADSGDTQPYTRPSGTVGDGE